MSYRSIDADKPNLLLPDGRRADSLRLYPLLKELERLGIPGIAASMNKQDALGVYEAAVLARLKAITGTTPVKRRSGIAADQPSPTAMREAAAAIEAAR